MYNNNNNDDNHKNYNNTFSPKQWYKNSGKSESLSPKIINWMICYSSQ